MWGVQAVVATGAGTVALERLLSVHCLLGCQGDPRKDLAKLVALPALGIIHQHVSQGWPCHAMVVRQDVAPMPCHRLSSHPLGITA